jgi:hypothetical protein
MAADRRLMYRLIQPPTLLIDANFSVVKFCLRVAIDFELAPGTPSLAVPSKLWLQTCKG